VDLFLLAVNDGGGGGGAHRPSFTGLRGQCPLGADGMSHYQPPGTQAMAQVFTQWISLIFIFH
jgi:hypothetical protein